jgi:serine/threonine-protein kinase RsbW
VRYASVYNTEQPERLFITGGFTWVHMPTKSFPGTYKSLNKIRKFVAGFAKKAGLNEDGIYAVKLAVDEACSNIIEHGYGGEGIGKIDCTCQVKEGGLQIVLRDWGTPFNPDEIRRPDFTKPIQDLELRGAGLHLIRNLMDEVSFDFSENQGNVIRLSKYKTAPSR